MLHSFFFYPSSGFPDWCIFRHGGPCSAKNFLPKCGRVLWSSSPCLAEKWMCSPVFERRGSLRAASVWCLPEGLVMLFRVKFLPKCWPFAAPLLASDGLVVTMLLFLLLLCVCSTGEDCLYLVLTSVWTF